MPLLQDAGALDASVQAVWIMLALKSIIGASEHTALFQTIETNIADSASFIYRPFYFAGASVNAEIAAARSLEMANELYSLGSSEADFFSSWAVPKVKKSKTTAPRSNSPKARISSAAAAGAPKAAGVRKAKGAGVKTLQKKKDENPEIRWFWWHEDEEKGKCEKVSKKDTASSTNSPSSSQASSSTPEAQQAAVATSASSSPFSSMSHGYHLCSTSPLRPSKERVHQSWLE